MRTFWKKQILTGVQANLRVIGVLLLSTAFAAFNGLHAQEIDIRGNSTVIADGETTTTFGDHTKFGGVNTGTGTLVRTFTIFNTSGGPDLTLSGGPNFVTLTGASEFSVTAQPTSPISDGANSPFTITFDATGASEGVFTATVSVSSDDGDESPYTFDVEARVDDTNPGTFNVNSAAAVGGTTVTGYFNGTNVTTSVEVQIANDLSLESGTVQIQARTGANSYVNVGSAATILSGNI